MEEAEDGMGGESFLTMYVISGLIYKLSSDFDYSLASSRLVYSKRTNRQ